MKHASAAALVVALSGCSYLGTAPSGALPRNPHEPPSAQEIADHPCRYHDVAACVARCQADDPQACNAAGVLFEFDDGESSNPEIASGFYSRSCRNSYGPGCNNLAWLYLRGRGVPEDHPHAMFLFMAAFDASKIACYRGDASGCLLAGELLYEGRGVSANEDEAVAFFKLACDRGETRACGSVEAR